MDKVSYWITNADSTVLFQKQPVDLEFENRNPTTSNIEIYSDQHYQSIDGFGFCLTGGSAQLINHMDKKDRLDLIRHLFDTTGTNIGISYLRVTIGASDLDAHVFSYDDLPLGQNDINLEHFSLDEDRKNVIPVLKEILTVYPGLKILGSPWSAPVWMKTNGDTRGGSLKPEYYDVYARYFVKYIKEMQNEGITIDAITPQNEPLHPGNNPSMYMLPQDQAEFIKRGLGPEFEKAGIKTKIIVYDHNADRPDYPITIYKDAEASKYVDGAAFHLYAGSIDTLTYVHNAFPSKNLYFTEEWVGGPGNLAEDMSWHIRTLIIGGTRNWCKSVLEWNLASAPDYEPHTDRGGCDRCLGGITINKNSVSYNPGYYIIAHSAKFVRPGSIRIGSSYSPELPNVAFLTPSGKIVVIVQNNSSNAKAFSIRYRNNIITTTLKAGSVGTYIW